MVSAQPDFWNDSDEAEKTMKVIQGLKEWTKHFEELSELFGEVETYYEFLEMGEATEEEVAKAYKKP